MDELQSRVLDSNCKVGNLKKERKKLSNKFKAKVKHSIFRRKMNKLLSCCKLKRENARMKHDDKVRGLVKKYGVMSFVCLMRLVSSKDAEYSRRTVK